VVQRAWALGVMEVGRLEALLLSLRVHCGNLRRGGGQARDAISAAGSHARDVISAAGSYAET